MSTTRLMTPMTSRNIADTLVPIRPPISWNAGMSLMIPAEMRDQDRQRDDDRRVAEREEEPDGDRALAVLHELARGVVDGGDVVRVDRVAQAEGVGQEGGRQQDRVLERRRQRDGPAPTLKTTRKA